jgi:hypothetical protein
MSSVTLRERLQPLIPLIFSSQSEPVLHWLIASDGRVTRRTLHGDVADAVLEPHVMSQLAACVNDLRKGRSVFLEHDNGLVFGGVWNADNHGQLRLAITPEHLWRMEDWGAAIAAPVFRYLQALVAAGHNLWIVGDTTLEIELAAALCTRSALVRLDEARPAPKGSVALPQEITLAAALEAQRQGGFDHLLWCGEMTPEVMLALESHSGVVLVQRGQSPDWALQRSGLAERPDVAGALSAIAAVVKVQRAVDGSVRVANVAEFRSSEGGLALAAIAERSAEALRFSMRPQLSDALAAAGAVIGDLPEDILGEDEGSDENAPLERDELAPRGAASIRQSLQRGHGAWRSAGASERGLEQDPGWELDALGEDGALISAPGPAGQGGLMRARPLIRPPAPAEGGDSGELTLDAPHRIGIPEAPSGQRVKRSFAEIMRERHRYPPMSSDGSPALTPPVIPTGDSEDEDIVP